MDQPTPSRPRKSVDDRLASLAERQQQLEARRQSLLAVKKTGERKRDTRRRVIVGAAVLSEVQVNDAFAATIGELLDRQVVNKADRALIADLLQLRLDGL
jgi:hypothetical protein